MWVKGGQKKPGYDVGGNFFFFLKEMYFINVKSEITIVCKCMQTPNSLSKNFLNIIY